MNNMKSIIGSNAKNVVFGEKSLIIKLFCLKRFSLAKNSIAKNFQKSVLEKIKSIKTCLLWLSLPIDFTFQAYLLSLDLFVSKYSSKIINKKKNIKNYNLLFIIFSAWYFKHGSYFCFSKDCFYFHDW